MPYFLNPFHKHDVSEFPGVLVPLASAQHRRTSVISKNDLSDDAGKESTGSSEWTGGMTVESLRAEIDADLAAGGVDTAYDRTC